MISSVENPIVEQRDLLAGKRVFKTEKAVIFVSGADANKWLHSMLTQDILNLKVGESTEALLLNPQGRIEFVLHVLRSSDGIFLILPSAAADNLLSYLRGMVFRSSVEIEKSTKLSVVSGFGEIDVLAEFACWVDSWPKVSKGGYRYSGSNFGVWDYREWLVPIAKAKKLPLAEAGSIAIDALRIAAARPDFVDIDDVSLPHEFDWLTSAVHLDKGCYRGQEAVAKTHNLGHPPRRLTLLSLESTEELPVKGAPVRLSQDGEQVGKICAAANHFEQGGLALALLRRSVPLELEVEVETQFGGVLRAVQVEVVPTDAGRVAPAPRMPSLKLGSRG